MFFQPFTEWTRLVRNISLFDMKNFYLLLLFSSLATLTVAQQKPEFGFVAKFGTYAIPSSKTESSAYGSNTSQSTFTQKLGQTQSIGFWSAVPIGKYVRLSAELLYRRGTFSNSQAYFSEYFDGASSLRFWSTQNQSIHENTLSLPIKIHLTFKENGKTTFAFGGGLSRIFSATVRSSNEYKQSPSSYPYPPSYPYPFPIVRSNWSDFEIGFNMTAGLHHRLDNKTSIGIEYTFEKSPEQGYSYLSLSSLAIVDCLCYDYYLMRHSNMNSFSVSLRHNILD